MLNTNKSAKLPFPWDGVLPAVDQVIVRDVDVVGVGAIRRSQLLEIKKTKQIILQTHSAYVPVSVRSIYDEELKRTLQWLSPLKVIAENAWDFKTEVLNTFARIFPKTRQHLGDLATKICEQYLQEMEWSSWLLQDHWRYFSGYVRQKYPHNSELRELVQWEWVHAWLEIQPFESTHGERGQLVLNPSMQLVNLTHAHAMLNRSAGLYTFVCDQEMVKIIELKLDIYEAALLDFLAEDRNYTSDQLLQRALLEEFDSRLTEVEWKEKIEKLNNCELIVQIKG